MEKLKEAQDFTVQEASALFKVTNPTIYKMINEGRLKTYLIGRSRRITHESIQRLREER
ncbi:helix-turn-helix domain-containing protein [Pseudomonadota bacterium]